MLLQFRTWLWISHCILIAMLAPLAFLLFEWLWLREASLSFMAGGGLLLYGILLVSIHTGLLMQTKQRPLAAIPVMLAVDIVFIAIGLIAYVAFVAAT